MLKRLKVKNFQSHKNTELVFSKGINVFVGESTSGKTAIFRAIQWLLNNRPLGNRFKSVFAQEDSDTSVFAEFEGASEYGDEFAIIEKNKETIYRIGSEALGVVDTFKGVGSDVPDSVKRLLNLDEINIQNQLDQHFLITSSSGDVAKTINKIIHLEDVDYWVSSLTSKINGINKHIRIKEEDIKTMNNELSLFPDLDDFESCIVDAENIQKEILSIKNLIDSIENILIKIESINKEIEILEEWLGIDKYLKEVKIIYDDCADAVKKIKALENFIECCMEIDNLAEFIDGVSGDIKECIKINSGIAEITMAISSLYKLYNSCVAVDKNIKELNRDKMDFVEKYKEELLKISTCPLCFSKITKEKVNEIVACI